MSPYVALEDVTVHKREGELAEGDSPANIDAFRSVTLSPGEVIEEDELHPHEVELYKQGTTSHLLQKVSKSQAVELKKMMAAGDDVNIKLIKDVITARGSGEEAKASTSKGTSKDEAK